MLENYIAQNAPVPEASAGENGPIDDRTADEIKEDDAKLYDISKFSV